MNKHILTKLAIGSSALLPFIAQAQDISSALTTVQTLLNSIIPVLMILATIVFLWGVIKYITAGGDEEALKTGRAYMIFGLIGLFVMVAVWGIVVLLINTFGVGGVGIPTGGPGSL